MEKARLKEIQIGVVSLLALAIFYFGVRFLRGTDFLATNNTYYMVYPEVSGLTDGSSVTLSGMNVGQVRSIELHPNGKDIIVKADIRKSVPIGDGTLAELISTDLLGTKGIGLKLGPNSKIYGADDTLKTAIEESMTDAIAKTAKPLIGKFDTTAGKVNYTLDEFSTTQKEIVLTLREYRKTAEQINALLAENRNQMKQVSGNLAKLSGSLIETEKTTRSLLVKMNTFADTLNKAQLGRMVQKATVATENLNQILVRMNRGEGTLGKLSKNDSLYRNLNGSAQALERLLSDMKGNPKKYVHFSIFGRKQKPEKPVK